MLFDLSVSRQEHHRRIYLWQTDTIDGSNRGGWRIYHQC